jgi:hypothetical protein
MRVAVRRTTVQRTVACLVADENKGCYPLDPERSREN